MHRLAIEYIELLSLWLVCAVLILTAQERWSEERNNRDQGSDYKVHIFFSLPI